MVFYGPSEIAGKQVANYSSSFKLLGISQKIQGLQNCLLKQISYASQKNLHNSLKNHQKLLQIHKKPHALFSNDLDIPKDLSTLFENLTASFRQDVPSKGPMYNFTRRKKRRKATKSATTGRICLLPRAAHSVKGLFLCLFFSLGFGNAHLSQRPQGLMLQPPTVLP